MATVATLDTCGRPGNLSVTMLHRTLQPEVLDSLPVDHPAARHNRRDLRWTNQIAGSHRWLDRALRQRRQATELVLELGAGTGELGQRLHAAGVPLDGLDLWPRPPAWANDRAWHIADLRRFDGYDRYAVVCGNLIFHQFSDADLAALGERLRRSARVIIACEPARRRISQILYRTFGPILGANYVSLHDAHVSIAAGFRHDELPRALGLDSAWHTQVTTSLLGLYRMVAVRRP